MTEYSTKKPLVDYPWRHEAVRIIKWLKSQPLAYRPFIFDVCMSLAYIDSASGLEKKLETCPSCPNKFNAHIGFINLCSPCFELHQTWQYQKAAKPQSGTLGKLSSEMILKFIEILFDEFTDTCSIGGTEVADARLLHKNGNVILAEVKSAPLLTFPLLARIPDESKEHKNYPLTSSQFRELESALYLHNKELILLGQIKNDNWPFKPVADFLENPQNDNRIRKMFSTWNTACSAYSTKDKNSHLYFLANASGNPPKTAKECDNWPIKESISDSKTSAGMDRTDDIKKGIYQVLKIGIGNRLNTKIETALISNLPAYRHGKEYVDPFMPILWGAERDIVKNGNESYLRREDLRYVFDHLITLDAIILR